MVNLFEEGYHLFDVRISIINHSNSYVDIVFANIEGNQIKHSIKSPCFAFCTQIYQCVIFKRIKKP